MPTVPDIHRRGTRAAQATIAAPPLTVGTLYYVTDETKTERWNGTAWETYGGPAAGAGPLTPHHTTHETGGTDAVVALDAAVITTGTISSARLPGTMPPGAHAATHASAGSDPVTVTTLAGYPGGSTTFLRADGTFATPAAGTPSAHHTTHETGGTDAITALAASVITTGTIASARLPMRTGAVGLIIDGGGSAITTGVKGFLSIPFACTITGWTLLSTDSAATAGSIVIDVWKDTYANYPPTVADTITASAKPTLSAANKNTSTTLTGWTTAVAAGDVLGVNVDSAATVTRIVIALTVQV